MENNKNKKSVKLQGDMLNFSDFIQVFVFTRNHHLKLQVNLVRLTEKITGFTSAGYVPEHSNFNSPTILLHV